MTYDLDLDRVKTLTVSVKGHFITKLLSRHSETETHIHTQRTNRIFIRPLKWSVVIKLDCITIALCIAVLCRLAIKNWLHDVAVILSSNAAPATPSATTLPAAERNTLGTRRSQHSQRCTEHAGECFCDSWPSSLWPFNHNINRFPGLRVTSSCQVFDISCGKTEKRR